jgi:hypothetical protein
VTASSPVTSLVQIAVLKFEIAIIDLKLAKLAVQEWILT